MSRLGQRILFLLRGNPMTVDELAERIGTERAYIRMELWYLGFADRKVTCDRHGRYSLGAPPDDWPRLKRVIS
jgi:predicted transcriptional regulator